MKPSDLTMSALLRFWKHFVTLSALYIDPIRSKKG